MDLTEGQSIARFETIAQLHSLGLAMEREKIRRAHPHLSDEEVRRHLLAWLGHEGFDDPGDPCLVRRPARKVG